MDATAADRRAASSIDAENAEMAEQAAAYVDSLKRGPSVASDAPNTNVGEVAFKKVYEGLQQFLGWEKVVNTMEDVYYADAENVRMSVDCEEQRSLVRKSKIENVDFVGIETSPFDVRFSVNHEEPMQGEFVWDRKRSKQRTSFIRKNLSIDMTFSTGAAFDKDDESPACYQIEMEVVDPSEISCEEELFNIAYKINDIMRILK